MKFLCVLNDGETYTDLDGCAIIAVGEASTPEETDERIDVALDQWKRDRSLPVIAGIVAELEVNDADVAIVIVHDEDLAVTDKDGHGLLACNAIKRRGLRPSRNRH